MKKFNTVILFLSLAVSVFAQNNVGKSDDEARLTLAPFIASNTSVPEFAQSLLRDRLTQVVTKNGLGGEAYDQRFVITANLVETLKDISATSPAIHSVTMETTIYIGDISTGTLFASCSLGELKGAGKSENLAYMSVVKRIQANDPRIMKCIDQGKEKIIEYYNTQIDFLISKANALADQDQYTEAIYLLMDVPDVCKDAYEKAMTAIAGIYQREIDAESAAALAKANAIWSATMSYEGALQAAEYLSQVHPRSSSAAAAKTLNAQISARVKEIDKREWTYTLNEQRNEYNLSRAAIEAAKAVGIAQAKRPIYNNVVYWW